MITSVSRILAPRTERRPAPAETHWSGARTKPDGSATHARRVIYPLGAGGVLSHEQKARLCILARRAFVEVAGRDPATAAELDQFRHEEVQKAIGKHGLTLCLASDYKPLQAHFLALAGEEGRALQAHLDHATEPRRVALAKLEKECVKHGKSLSYVRPICRAKFKCDLDEASAAQLWKLFFDMRKRKAPQETRKAEEPF